MHTHTKRFTSGACLAALSLSLLSACGDTPSAQTGGEPKPQVPAQGPTTISAMLPYFTTEPPKADNPVFKKLEEMTNTKLNMTWVPNAAYKDKLSVSLASNDLPQISVIVNLEGGIYAPSILNGVRSGAFWEIGPMLKDYPNLSKLNKEVLDNISHDGKLYALYRPRVLARGGVIFRKDWLDALSLKEPRTIDELYNVIKAFTLNDPDKNGKNDTYGLISRKGIADLDMLSGFFGAGNGWEQREGKLVPSFLTQEYMDALQFYRRLYTEKLMNPDFAVSEGNQSKALFENGKGGVVISTAIDDVIANDREIKKINPKGAADIVSRIQGPKGERILASSGYNGIFMFPKSSVKTEAEMRAILTFFDKMLEPDIANLLNWGIEGKHYHMENGKAVTTEAEQKLKVDDLTPVIQLSIAMDTDAPLEGVSTPLEQKLKKMFKENVPIAVQNPAASLISPTLSEKSGELDKIRNDAKVKFILGEIDENGWNQEMEKWKKSGGEQGIAEINAEYAKRKK
ncbi:extracellular solute-binding protein [Paenibacillus thalictri]|uniref:Extracellular solute-binding protein n=1 Tax=Paenibacillus thalictri TaxID=2527873 RepID=A0A4Q9DQ51_9BACL|nr:extracellular solute-binding protein [Paenibacillus thalictri]TBL78546.1 extracellular solute-binding protein [Paenibacillus thalictri]